MKTSKYYIENDFLENDMLLRMEISKKEFNRQLAFLRQQIKTTKDDECPIVEPEYSGRTHEVTSYTETRYYFRSGCAETCLVEMKTKEGFYFLTDKERKARRTTV